MVLPPPIFLFPPKTFYRIFFPEPVPPSRENALSTSMHQAIDRLAAPGIPSLIKRNTALFALSQSFTGVGLSFAYGIGPLMVIALTSSANLSGLSVALIGLSRFLVAYPVGKITDVFGRKPGIVLGQALALAGSLVLAVSMTLQSPLALVVGMLAFGMGMNAAQQLRVAVTDMFPPYLRAQALGYVALGSLLGLAVSPFVIGAAERLAHQSGQDPLGLPWLLLPALIVPGMVLVAFVRPDPKEIGMHLDRYFPGHAPPSPPSGYGSTFSAFSLIRHVPTRLAIVANCAAQGNMSIVMVLTSLVLAHHGHSLTAIAFSHMFHAAGMFAFTIPLGKLADRIGRGKVMFPGVATTLVGALLVTFTESFSLVTLGTFLVGLGWAAANVAATAFIADQCETSERGRAIGVNDSFAGAMAVLAAVVTGPLIEWAGLPAAGMAAALIAVVPLLMLAAAQRVAHAM
jgi:MFS family permease